MADSQISMSTAQFEQMMVRLAAELRKPPVDPIKEKQAARQKEMRDQGNKEMWERKATKKKICLHSRPDGSCVIAWAKQSDENWRGYCPHCDSTFSVAEDGVEEFRRLFNRPRGMMESVRVVA